MQLVGQRYQRLRLRDVRRRHVGVAAKRLASPGKLEAVYSFRDGVPKDGGPPVEGVEGEALATGDAPGRVCVPGDERGSGGEMEDGPLAVGGTRVGDQVVRQIFQKSALSGTEYRLLARARSPVRLVGGLGEDRRRGAGGERDIQFQAVAAENAAGGVGDLDFGNARAIRIICSNRPERRRGVPAAQNGTSAARLERETEGAALSRLSSASGDARDDGLSWRLR